MRSRSDLTLDVNTSEGCRAGCLKEVARFACQKYDIVGVIFKQILALLVNDELGCIRIRLEAKLFSDESELDIGFVPV